MAKHPTDIAVGKRVREFRIRRGMSQVALGEALDVSFQQVQKYENGANRMGASRLAQICTALDVPISALFQDIPLPKVPGAAGSTSGDAPHGTPHDPLGTQAARVAAALQSIPDATIRDTLAGVIRAVAKGHTRGNATGRAPSPSRQATGDKAPPAPAVPAHPRAA